MVGQSICAQWHNEKLGMAQASSHLPFELNCQRKVSESPFVMLLLFTL